MHSKEKSCNNKFNAIKWEKDLPNNMTEKVDKNSFEKLSRLKELRVKHQEINAEIDLISSKPETDQLSLRRLKTRRLLLKDMITSLESSIIPDIDA